jgi:cleavage and polyadenylation specificity factor subunit 2
LRHVRLCHDRQQLDSLALQGARVILASTPDLDYGFARDLLVEVCEDSKNLLMFTERGTANTLARKIVERTTPERIKVEVIFCELCDG